MKKLVLLLVLASVVAVAQQAAPPPAQSTNLVEREAAPTYSDLYCAGFVTRQTFDRNNYVAGNQETPHTTLASGGVLYLNGSGYQENQLYSVVRELRDPNRYELFPGQRRLLQETGQPYAELGRVRVFQVRPNMAIAKIEFSCQPMTSGDLVVPFQEKAKVSYRKEKVAFNEFPTASKQVGRILMAREFDMFLGTGQKVYINAGEEQGLKVGDYVRVMRGYQPSDMDAADALSYRTPSGEDTQKNYRKMTAPDTKALPRRALGEIIILSVTPTSATGMITLALDAIKVGDAVDLEGPEQ